MDVCELQRPFWPVSRFPVSRHGLPARLVHERSTGRRCSSVAAACRSTSTWRHWPQRYRRSERAQQPELAPATLHKSPGQRGRNRLYSRLESCRSSRVSAMLARRLDDRKEDRMQRLWFPVSLPVSTPLGGRCSVSSNSVRRASSPSGSSRRPGFPDLTVRCLLDWREQRGEADNSTRARS